MAKQQEPAEAKGEAAAEPVSANKPAYEDLQSPLAGAGTWAEQMESPITPKPTS